MQLILSSEPLFFADSPIIFAILLKLFSFSEAIFETSFKLRESQTPSDAKTQ